MGGVAGRTLTFFVDEIVGSNGVSFSGDDLTTAGVGLGLADLGGDGVGRILMGGNFTGLDTGGETITGGVLMMGSVILGGGVRTRFV